jgi:RNA polymerase sigma factor (sigma-70 family)
VAIDMKHEEIIPHLFRTEYRKIVSVLCKRFGFDQIEVAEDIASDTFMTATQTWPLKGVPENPTGWLYMVARNKANNYLQHGNTFQKKVAPELKNEMGGSQQHDIDLSSQNIQDSQLQMMFAICHPAIPAEAQIGLSLRILCGFGIDEIADAFLSNKETINKRLVRAREKLRELKVSIEVPRESEIGKRLPVVLTTIYLLFNEGYYSTSQNAVLRKDFCLEAMRLCHMLTEHLSTNKPEVNALLALMCFHASRFEARLGRNGEMIMYEEQDTSLWNQDLITRGALYLKQASGGEKVSKYHLEATIAWWHTRKEDSKEKWESILQLYNHLLQLEYSPIAALNRTYALSKANGKAVAIEEAEKLQLHDNQFYFTLLGELYVGIDTKKAKLNFRKALELAKTDNDKNAIQKALDKLV